MSPRNFARVYKQKTGRTPAKAVEVFRLEAAHQQVRPARQARRGAPIDRADIVSALIGTIFPELEAVALAPPDMHAQARGGHGLSHPQHGAAKRGQRDRGIGDRHRP